MKLGIKGKQVLGVTAILGVVVVVLSLMDLARLAQVSLDESRARADLLSKLIFHRAREIAVDGVDIRQALGGDPGLRSILQSSLYSKNVTFAAIADVDGVAIAHADPDLDGKPLDPVDPASDLAALVTRAPIQQLAFIYYDQGRNLQLEEPLLFGNTKFGSIRIGVSTLLIRHDLNASLEPAAVTALIALGVTVLGALLLAQALLRPIHVIRSGLTRLGRGELGVHLDLDQDDEFGELGAFFNTVSAQLSADRSQMAGQVANLESAVEHLEDAVAIISPGGVFLFVNPAMRSLVPDAAPGRVLRDIVANDHPVLQLFEQTLASLQPRGPLESG
jgi:methyl-accepting chemotaxis protein